MQSFQIRPATPDDAPGLHAAIDRVAREERWLGSAMAKAAEVIQASVSARVEAGEPYYLAAEQTGSDTVIGWCDVARYPAESRHHCGYLGMGLLPDWRGRGLGADLLKAALDHADRIGLARVELDVVSDNAPAIALYEKAGFRQEGLKRAAWALGGQVKDLVLMARVLGGRWE